MKPLPTLITLLLLGLAWTGLPDHALADAEAPQASATIIVLNPPPTGAQPLVQRLKQVLKPTQAVKVLPSTNPREIRLQVTPFKDLRALANKIPFGKVERVDDRTKTITVDYEQ